VNVTFFGVRGSTPCACDATRRYGGNTACVALQVPGEDPIVLDMGTGLRFFGETQPTDGTFRGTALVSHLHWDHIQGLPFFVPVLRDGAVFDVYAPKPPQGTVADTFDLFMTAPYFPITVRQLPGDVRFHDVREETFAVGRARVTARSIPHIGLTYGYRIEWDGIVVAYLPDHQQPNEGGFEVADSVLELADGVDLLIHDSQYTPSEFALKSTWGHCTYDYALWVAKRAAVKRLALFHHDPGRTDDALDETLACCRSFGRRAGMEVIAAAEGLTVAFSPLPRPVPASRA
jgi:phosphoribosyl 1,2-cyclic phosphodiesterase